MNDASTEIGSATPVMMVDRHEFRNRKTTSTVSAAPSTSARCTSPTERPTRTPASRTTLNWTSGGSVARIPSSASRTLSATLVVL